VLLSVLVVVMIITLSLSDQSGRLMAGILNQRTKPPA